MSIHSLFCTPLKSISLGLTLFLMVFSCQLGAQRTYIPLQNMEALETKLIQECSTGFELCMDKKEVRKNKEYKEFIELRHQVIKEYIKQDKYLFDEYFYSKGQKILAQLMGSDSSYIMQIKDLLIGRSFVPNAYCYGNGVLVINLGLISRFENDDQMAYVIAHEMAHQLMDHVDGRIKNTIAYYKSKEYRDGIREIKKDSYNNLSEYEDFMMKQELNSSSYSRERENQADSMAVELMKKAGFNPNGAIGALQILDKSDIPIYDDSIDFKKHFSNNDFVFDSNWLRKSNGLMVEQKFSQTLLDSLKTHPDCDARANRLTNLFALDSTKQPNIDPKYTEMQFKALMENIQYCLSSKKYGLALTESLQMLNHFPDNRYLQSTVGICLAEIHFAQEAHKLREFVPRPDDDYHYNYHRVLLMIENMRLSEIKKMAIAYMAIHNEKWTKETIESEQHLLYHQYLYNKLKGDTATALFKNIYLENFPDGYFTHSFN